MKRAGKGHDVGGVASTREGECALLCPCCPHPNINMAAGWQDEPENTRYVQYYLLRSFFAYLGVCRYIHALNIGLDANYCLKRKDVSSNEADPGLSKGFAYFVNDGPFRAFLADHEKDKEPKSTCSRHDAVNLADVRPGHGYAATGVATVECTRHNMKRPSAVCDLQKGERSVFGDLLAVLHLILINCQILQYGLYFHRQPYGFRFDPLEDLLGII